MRIKRRISIKDLADGTYSLIAQMRSEVLYRLRQFSYQCERSYDILFHANLEMLLDVYYLNIVSAFKVLLADTVQVLYGPFG
jgi:hypothetical protein